MKTAIGQDSHRFEKDISQKKLVLAGVIFEGLPALSGNSDGDAVYHSIANAISGITCVNILGEKADQMCRQGITDSSRYVLEALGYLKGDIIHLSISIECALPKISPSIPEMRKNISRLLNINEEAIGITATSGEGLTAFGRGEGIQVFSCITVSS